MFMKLFLLFIFVPLIELYTLISIGSVIGSGNTILLVLTTGAIGAYLAKREGLTVWTKIQSELKAGNLPKNELIDGVLLLLAGVVLITPGIFTDIFGILLLTPLGRKTIRSYMVKRFQQSGSTTMGASFQHNTLHGNGTKTATTEADYTILDDE